MTTAISVDNVWKRYRKGQTGYHTLREDIYNLTGRLMRFKRGDDKADDEQHIWALRDVSFQIEQGERVGIIGRNGSGKTTLLRLLAGITSPNSGKITVKGRLGVLIEIMAGFHPELSGRENIYLNGAIMGMSRKEIKRKFDEIVAFAELESFIDTPIKRYSSGMHVRLGFAVSAHLDPDIMLVDEVLAVGDASFQKKCLGKMGTAAQEGRTVVFVSHNMGSISNLCERTIWLDGGYVRMIGPSGEIISEYLSSVAQGTLTDQTSSPVQVTKVILRNRSGQPTTVFSPGEDIDILVHYVAKKRYDNPYIWISVATTYGGIFSANMFMDGQRPKYIEGEGTIGCRFYSVPLMPQSYSLVMAIRASDRSDLFEPQHVASFHVVGALSDFGLMGETADAMAQVADPIVIPYEWYYPDGTKTAVQITPLGER
jgi:lipopolysaccharide transport system ATP-binding protein